jgi:hypothetical protein
MAVEEQFAEQLCFFGTTLALAATSLFIGAFALSCRFARFKHRPKLGHLRSRFRTQIYQYFSSSDHIAADRNFCRTFVNPTARRQPSIFDPAPLL